MAIGVSSDDNGERLTGDAGEATGGDRDAPFFSGREIYWITGISVLELDLGDVSDDEERGESIPGRSCLGRGSWTAGRVF